MSTLLDKIKLPETLKELSTKQLEQLAAEIRHKIIEVTARTGGHVASSLGAVELTLALHASFDSPRDKIVWDVGHQAYAHKILTGRLESFSTLRQAGGISGFPNAQESPHDQFTVGHASTSIAQALGLVKARELANEKHAVVAVIGDGSLSGGLAYEAINNVNGLKSNVIVILNDNDMSISRNVGSIANYLTQVTTSNAYVELRNRIEKLVKRIPRVGVSMFEAARKLKDRTKHIVVSFKVDVIFEELGFKYFGPIDGHNIPLIISTLHHAKDVPGPVLIHVLTKKGKGYPPAEHDPTRFHGTGPYEIESGKPLNGNGKTTYTQAFGQALTELARADERIVAVTAAMLDGTGLDDFAQAFPERFIDVGIAEEHAVTMAGAMAKGGSRPVVAIYSTFLQRAFDEIAHDVCLQNLPVTFAIDRGGIVGEDGATHNGLFDLAYLRCLPNIVVMAPGDDSELKKMLAFAVQHPGPVALRYPRGAAARLERKSSPEITLGKGEVVFGDPRAAVRIVALGSMVSPAIAAAKQLGNCAVINARFVKPLDRELILQAARDCGLLVTIEEGGLEGGFGSAVLELLDQERVSVKTLRLGLPTAFIEHGQRDEVLAKYGLTGEGIFRKIKENL
ncbi:MAG: 1-deoxy-D-xylulose-5-phosphate synthase [Candidatus Margulisbacteria bacterium]|jgi:1-deoxy-D-xylulose-5-phosphate synthase|nr:1-deoxy-D-xylulose-5-phosphate synthase [Candidatus Margulisiibacteriota bacterium]